MIGMYVDNCGVSTHDPADINWLIEELKKMGFDRTKEGSFSDFGIKITNLGDGTGVHLTQKGLIAKIINVMGMQGCNPNHIPATQVALGSDPEGDTMKEVWSYSSVIGMLLYLLTNTHPDITITVSQVARFSSAPKQSHATAVKMIVCYLSATTDQGTIMQPTGKLNFDAYCDEDFAGLHCRQPDHSPISVRSCTSYIICLETARWFGSLSFKPGSFPSAHWKRRILPSASVCMFSFLFTVF